MPKTVSRSCHLCYWDRGQSEPTFALHISLASDSRLCIRKSLILPGFPAVHDCSSLSAHYTRRSPVHLLQTTLFQNALELGALATGDLTDKVTHLVAKGPGSAKYRVSTCAEAARSPSHSEMCSARWRTGFPSCTQTG